MNIYKKKRAARVNPRTYHTDFITDLDEIISICENVKAEYEHFDATNSINYSKICAQLARLQQKRKGLLCQNSGR